MRNRQNIQKNTFCSLPPGGLKDMTKGHTQQKKGDRFIFCLAISYAFSDECQKINLSPFFHLFYGMGQLTEEENGLAETGRWYRGEVV